MLTSLPRRRRAEENDKYLVLYDNYIPSGSLITPWEVLDRVDTVAVDDTHLYKICDIVSVNRSVLEDDFSKACNLTASDSVTIVLVRHILPRSHGTIIPPSSPSTTHSARDGYTLQQIITASFLPVSEIKDCLPKNCRLAFNDTPTLFFEDPTNTECEDNEWENSEEYEEDNSKYHANMTPVEDRWEDRIGATPRFNDRFPLADCDTKYISTFTSFPKFSKLPSNIRKMIWKFAMPRRLITMILRTDALKDKEVQKNHAKGGPGYNRTRRIAESNKPSTIRINFEYDILYFYPPVDAMRTLEDEYYLHILEIIKKALSFKSSEVKHMILDRWCYIDEKVPEMLGSSETFEHQALLAMISVGNSAPVQ
ncbi:hypothetical protein ACMFMG_012135 [Clarireedia jacksonii]